MTHSLVCNNLAMDDLRLQMQATTVVINGETVIARVLPVFGIRIREKWQSTPFDLTALAHGCRLIFREHRHLKLFLVKQAV